MTTYASPAYDLRSLIESRALTRLTYSKVRTDGGVYTGPCPFPGCSSKNDAFHCWPNSMRPRYWCRVCGHKGDAIQFLRDYEHMTYGQALENLGLQEKTYSLPPTHMTYNTAPHKTWQGTGRALCHASQQCLWSPRGAAGLAYLHGRGFTDATIREAMLGYCPGLSMAGEQWGIQSKQLVIPKGIVIPWYCGGQLWKITLRENYAAVGKKFTQSLYSDPGKLGMSLQR